MLHLRLMKSWPSWRLSPPFTRIKSGFCLQRLTDRRSPLHSFQRATELDPKMAQAWYHLGVALWLAQQQGDAVRALQRAVTLAPDQGAFHYRLGSANKQTARYREAVPELVRASRQLSATAEVGKTWARLTNN